MPREPETTEAVLRRLGRRIAELRRARDLTQERAAELLGMLPPNYARIEQGRQNATVDTLVRIAGTLEVGILDLFKPPRSLRANPGRPPNAVGGARLVRSKR